MTFRIFGILCTILAVFMGRLAILRCEDAKQNLAFEIAVAKAEIGEYKKQSAAFSAHAKALADAQISKAEDRLKKIPRASNYFIMQIFFVVLVFISLALAIFLFRPNPNAIQFLVLATATTALLYCIALNMQSSEYGGIGDRTMVLVVGIPVIVSGLCGFLAERKNMLSQRHA